MLFMFSFVSGDDVFKARNDYYEWARWFRGMEEEKGRWSDHTSIYGEDSYMLTHLALLVQYVLLNQAESKKW